MRRKVNKMKTCQLSSWRGGRYAWGITCGAILVSMAVVPAAKGNSGLRTPLQISAGAPITDEFGEIIRGDSDVPRDERPLVQVLWAENGVAPPKLSGEPASDNPPVENAESSIGTLVAPSLKRSGLFGLTMGKRPEEGGELKEGAIVVRVYNAPTIEDSLFYADSTNALEITKSDDPLFAYFGPMTNIIDITRDTDGDGLPDWWEHLHNDGDATGLDPNTDYDGDGMTAWEEYVAGTDPHDPLSGFWITQIEHTHEDGELVSTELRWPSVAGRRYDLQYTTNLVSGEYTIVSDGADLASTPPTNIFLNVTPPDTEPVFYRARVRMD